MLGRLILIFVFVPLADLILLLVLSKYTGWQFSVALVILSGIVGAYLARRSYRAAMDKLRQRMSAGQFSPDLLQDGAMIFLAAGLLLTPGFITDVMGFSLLIPVCRNWYRKIIARWIQNSVNIQIITPSGFPGRENSDPNTVDGSVVRKPGTEANDDSAPKRIDETSE